MIRRKSRLAVIDDEGDGGVTTRLHEGGMSSQQRNYNVFMEAAKLVARTAPKDLKTWVQGDDIDKLQPRKRARQQGENTPEDLQQPIIRDHVREDSKAYNQMNKRSETQSNAKLGKEPVTLNKATSEPTNEDSATTGWVETSNKIESQGETIDTQYESFMNELESDGLLNDQEGTIEVGMQENAEKPATEAVEQISDRGQKIPGAERPIPKQSNPQDSLDNDQPNSASETEQRELGELKGAAGWSEVMDMGTRKVYFWHRDTNEVAWDPPPGSTPRSSLGQGTGPSSQGNNSEDKSIHESNQTHVIDSSVSDFEQQIAELSASLVAIQQRLDLSANGLPTTIQRLLVEAEIRIDDVRGLKQAEVWNNELETFYLEKLQNVNNTLQAATSGPVEANTDPIEPKEAQGHGGEDLLMPPLPSEAEEDGEEGEWQSADQLPSYPGQATFVSGATAPLPMEEAGAPLPEEVAPLPSDNDLVANPLSAPNNLQEVSPDTRDANHGETIQVLTSQEKRKREASNTSGGKRQRLISKRIGKGTSKLIDKWASVRKDLERENEEPKVLNDEELEEKRMQEAQQWREQAERSSTENANFQPVAGDWRQKVAAARRAKMEGQVANEGKLTAVPPTPDPSPDLPKGWQTLWDPSSQQYYYANEETKETTWDKPA